MHNLFYVIMLPALWIAVDFISFHHPGDEYGGWIASSVPALWVIPLIKNEGSPGGLLPLILAAGGVTMLGVGWTMDRLRVPTVPWAILALVMASALATYELTQYPSWERALAKNGSLTAYLAPAFSLGLVGSSVLMVLGTGFARLADWIGGPKPTHPTDKPAKLGSED